MNICEAVDMAIFSPKGRVLVSNIFLFFFKTPKIGDYGSNLTSIFSQMGGMKKPPSSDEIAIVSF